MAWHHVPNAISPSPFQHCTDKHGADTMSCHGPQLDSTTSVVWPSPLSTNGQSLTQQHPGIMYMLPVEYHSGRREVSSYRVVMYGSHNRDGWVQSVHKSISSSSKGTSACRTLFQAAHERQTVSFPSATR
jgi:hypothetical protein